VVVRLAGGLVAWWLVVWLAGERFGWLPVGGGIMILGWYVGYWSAWLAGWFGSTRQRLVPSPGALIVREVGGGQARHKIDASKKISLLNVLEASVSHLGSM